MKLPVYIVMISNGRCVKKSKDKNGEEQVIYLLVEVLDFQLTSSFVPCGHSGRMTHTDEQGVEGGGYPERYGEEEEGLLVHYSSSRTRDLKISEPGVEKLVSVFTFCENLHFSTLSLILAPTGALIVIVCLTLSNT